jgi:cytosine deaminase
MTTAEEMEILYDMISTAAARAMGIERFELKAGNPAHLVVLNENNVLEALRNHAEPRAVISHGALVRMG